MRTEMVHCMGWGKTGFGHYLPFEVPEADIEAAVDALKAANLVDSEPDGPPLRFKDFPVSPSNTGTVSEKKRYEPLVAIAHALQELTLTNGRSASCQFLQQPGSCSASKTYGVNLKMDALLKLKQSTMPPSGVQSSTTHVGDLAVPCEYKTSRKAIRENRKQLLGTTTFCMNIDPRRKYIYGITIEDDTMAVWYFSRSHSAKSPDFKFTEDCRTYIRVMLSLMFANEAELGYDPTIRRRLDPEVNKPCFVYEVNGHYYKMQKAIFDHRSLCITGRATRVWEAIEVKSFDELQPLEGSDTVILKDVWLDAGSMTEGAIQREMFGDLKKVADTLEAGVEPKGFMGMDDESKEMLRKCLLAQEWQQYFLTVVDEWEGTMSKEVAEAAQPDSTLFGGPPPTFSFSSLPHDDVSWMSLSEPSKVVPHMDKLFNRRHCPKRQSRVVFKEVCVALHHVAKLGDVVTALLSCVVGLELMFLAGWVHRDISSGNLYWFKNKKGEVRGILGDLEYAKRFRPSGATGSADPKTGTAFFMAVEIQKQLHLCRPQGLSEKYSYLLEDDPSEPMLERHPVVHNFEHDMESVFWLLLWILLVRFPCNLVDSKQRSKFYDTMSKIFQDTSTCSLTREGVFAEEGNLDDILNIYLDSQLQPIKRFISGLRGMLMGGYTDRQYNLGDLPSYSKLYRSLRVPLTKCLELAQTTTLPDLDQSRSLYVGAADTEATIRRRPLHVKRQRPQANAGDDDEYRPRSSKTTRVERSTAVSSSQAGGSADLFSSQAEGSADVSSSRDLRERNPGVSYVESDDESDDS